MKATLWTDGGARRRAAMTPSSFAAGTIVSTRYSATVTSRPASPTDGVVPSPPRNVPSPNVAHEQRE